MEQQQQQQQQQQTNTFVKDQETKSRKTIKDHYDSINALCWEFDYLDDLLARLKNKKECYNMDVITRNEEMDDIGERMTRILEDINLYKECINVEKKEMKRIHNIWGYGFTNATYESEYDNILEEPLKIKYNQILDTFEDLSQIPPPNQQLYYEYNPSQSNEVSTGGF
jgi:hypothetical protein